jgi:tetratricopeptide (TPR) repeat protein
MTATRRTPDEELVFNFFLGTALFALAVIVFWQAFHAGFIWDDDQLLTANQQVHDPSGWWTLFFKPQTADYFPITSVTLWFEWRLWGMTPYGYHITNVLLHATTVVLTWQTLKRLGIPGAWVAAAIFAVHPVCVESVAWISERKNTISQIFFLLSIIHYVRFEEKGRLWRYVAAIACFTLALLAKTAVVMLPFILLLLAWWRNRDLEPMRESYELEDNPVEHGTLLWSCIMAGAVVGFGAVLGMELLVAKHRAADTAGVIAGMIRLAGALAGGGSGYVVGTQVRKLKIWNRFAAFEVIRTIPFFLVAFVLGVVTVYFQYGRAIGDEVIPIGNPWQRTISACFAAGFYLYSALWPFNIIEIYPEWHRAFFTPERFPTPHMSPPTLEAIPYWKQVLPGIGILAVLVYCWVRRAEDWARAMLTGLGCYFIAMLPALGFLTMSYMRLTLVADHFQYISIVAVIALVVSAGYQRALRPAWLLLAAAAFSIFAWVNWNLTQDNHVPEIVWIAGTVGLALVPIHDEEVWRWVWRGFLTLVLLSFTIITWNLAGIYESEGTLWSATLAKNPNSWQAHNHLGAWLYMNQDIRGAFPHFLKATQLKPENPESHNNLGLAESYFGMKEEAIKEFQIAVTIKDDSAMDTNLANAYEEQGRYKEAIDEYKHAIEISPTNASAWCNMGYALMRVGDIDAAIESFIKAIEYDPGMPQGRTDLNQALRIRGIDPSAPPTTGTYPFDLDRAVELLRMYPPPPPQQGQPQ